MTYDRSMQRPLQYNVNYIKSLSFEDGLSDYSRFDYTPDGKMESETVT